MMKIKLLAAFAAAALALPAAAQTQAPAAEARAQQGVPSSQLTPKEAGKPDKGQAKVEVADTKAKADGKAAPQKKKVAKSQAKSGKKTSKQKHTHQASTPAK